MLHTPFYNPNKTYYENYDKGPFGGFASKKNYKPKGIPDHYIFGLPVYLPFGIPAGPLLNGKFVKAAFDKGFDIAVYKTVRTKEHPCNPWPNVVSLKVKSKLTLDMQDKGVKVKQAFDQPLTITNSFGVPSKDPTIWQKDMASTVEYARKMGGKLVIGSFQGTTNREGSIKKYIDDFAKGAKLIKEAGVKVLEVNLSCPNEGTAHLLCFDILRSRRVIEAIKNQIGNTPLIIKIAYFRDQRSLENLINQISKLVQGIATINTMPAKIYDQRGAQALPGENRLISGTCGAGVKWAGIEMTKRLVKLREELGFSFLIFGTGGVMEPKDYFEYRKAGADVVMSATGAMWNPFLAQEIKAKL